MQKPRLTWRLSSGQKKGPAASLESATEWAFALEHARKKMTRQRKASGVEIIIGVAEPQVLFLSFW